MKSWDDDNLQLLQDIYCRPEIHIDDIASIIGKSKNAVHLKANRIGLLRSLDEAMKNPKTRQKMAKHAKKRTGHNNPFYGKKHKPETIKAMKQKLSDMMRGEKNPFYGKKHSELAKRIMSDKKKKMFLGESNPAWRGGYEPYYGPNWLEQRRKVLTRDNHRCVQCGRTEAENGKELDVHHVIPFREFGIERYTEANREENLLTLCVSHHRRKLGGGD